MRYKKIRGHKRRMKAVDSRLLKALNYNLTENDKSGSGKHHIKINIPPWNGLSITKSVVPEPNGIIKQKMLSGLLDIYTDWKSRLDKLGVPYYLKLWIFEPQFSLSQVVCAWGDYLHFYDQTFFKPEIQKQPNLKNYGTINSRLELFKWDYCFNEIQYDNTTLGVPENYATTHEYEHAKARLARLMKQPHRTQTLSKPIGQITSIYSFKRGDIWIGEQP